MEKNYFTDEYKFYKNCLADNGKRRYVTDAENSYSKVTRNFNKFKRLVSDTDEWDGKIAELFKLEYFNYVNKTYDILSNNIIESLKQGGFEVDELVDLLENLEIVNNDYNKLLLEYSIEKQKNLSPMIKVGDTTTYVVNPDYEAWKKRLNDLATQIIDLESQLEELKISVFDTLSQIEKFDNNVVDLFSFMNCMSIMISDGVEVSTDKIPVSSEKSSEYDNLYMYSHNGVNYSIVCDGYFLTSFEAYVQYRKFYQASGKGWYPSECDLASTVYAHNLNHGYVTNGALSNSSKSAPITSKFEQLSYPASNSDSLIMLKKAVYEEVCAGRACALQVSNPSDPGLRHWVTVVGINEKVKGPEDLIPENILIIDNNDGKVQTLADSKRDFYAAGSERLYQIRKSNSIEVATIFENVTNMKYVASR